MKHFTRSEVLNAVYNLSYGIWVIGDVALDIHTKYTCDFGTIEFINFEGWSITNFTGYKNLPAQSDICLVELIWETGRKYHFMCPYESLLNRGKSKNLAFKFLGLPKSYTQEAL